MKVEQETHRCDLEMFPWPTRWMVECPTCGPVGHMQDSKEDAIAIAQRHEEVGGFEARH